MKANLLGTLVLACVLTTACGSSSDNNSSDQSAPAPVSTPDSNSDSQSSKTHSVSLSYEFEYNGCKTGKHTFSSKAELCKGLQDNALNNGCAENLREAYYQEACVN